MTVYFNDPTPEAAALRADQAMADADIEGLARDAEAEALIAAMDAEGLSPVERIARLRTFFLDKPGVSIAAE